MRGGIEGENGRVAIARPVLKRLTITTACVVGIAIRTNAVRGTRGREGGGSLAVVAMVGVFIRAVVCQRCEKVVCLRDTVVLRLRYVVINGVCIVES